MRDGKGVTTQYARKESVKNGACLRCCMWQLYNAR